MIVIPKLSMGVMEGDSSPNRLFVVSTILSLLLLVEFGKMWRIEKTIKMHENTKYFQLVFN